MVLSTLFENEFFIVVDKPSGWLSVPSRLPEQDQRHCLGTTLAKQFTHALFPVHRLDVEVSGLILFAKNKTAHQAANQWFEQRRVRKTYEAWTLGPIPQGMKRHELQTWKCRLLRGKKRAYEHALGKLALTQTSIENEKEWEGQLILEWNLHPETGRPHQLRYELFRHGRPALGDKLYGSEQPFIDSGIALRAVKLDLSDVSKDERFGLPEALNAPSLADYYRQQKPL